VLTVFKNLSIHWRLTPEELQGLVPRPSEQSRLSSEDMIRVSLLVNIFKGLHSLFSDPMANRWPHLKNTGPLFKGCTPIEFMIAGGIPAMEDVKQHVFGLM
jgi:hypothetical protein